MSFPSSCDARNLLSFLVAVFMPMRISALSVPWSTFLILLICLSMYALVILRYDFCWRCAGGLILLTGESGVIFIKQSLVMFRPLLQPFGQELLIRVIDPWATSLSPTPRKGQPKDIIIEGEI
jgi:hypothetical protein